MTSLVTDTFMEAASIFPRAKPKVAHQGGILEGMNPTKYDPKNPIILFIIQVCRLQCLRRDRNSLY